MRVRHKPNNTGKEGQGNQAGQSRTMHLNKPANPSSDRFVNTDNLLRGRSSAHSKDIICGDLAMHLDLIATGGRDKKVRIWDYERI